MQCRESFKNVLGVMISMESRKISVVIPVYNGELWIKRCVESLLNQICGKKYTLEIIIVDDGSVDNSPIIVDRYESSHPEIKVIHSSNKGVSVARNKGIQIATGEYITFVDVDDYVDPEFIDKMMDGIENDIDIISGGFNAEYTKATIKKVYPKTEIRGKEDILRTFFEGKLININVWGKVYKTTIAKKVLFNDKYKVGEDKLYLFECLLMANKITIVNACNYHYVVNDSSVMRESFSEKKLDGLIVSEDICNRVIGICPRLENEASSWLMDVKCRACDELLKVRNTSQYKKTYRDLLKDIRSYSIIKKAKYSNKKHLVVFMIMRISPSTYAFLKKNTKLQYR